MNTVHLAGVDLNLLVVLDALLRARSTTTAARRLGRTQSAVSHALSRLRALLGDELLVRAGAQLKPTAFAEAIEPTLRETLSGAEAIISRSTPGFDPSRLERTFMLATTDMFEVLTLPALLARVRGEAPGVDIWTRATGDDVERALVGGEADIAFGTRFRELSGLVVEPVGTDDMLALVRRGHPGAGKRLSLARYVALDHILVSPRSLPGSVIDDALAPLGHKRRVVLRLPHFAAAALIVAESDLCLTVPASLARAMARVAPLDAHALPFPSPEFVFAIAYTAARARDPAHAWLRAALADVARAKVGAGRLASRRQAS